MRTAMLPLCKTSKATETTASSKSGKAAEATVSRTPPWGAPEGQKEGSSSSSSKGNWKVESRESAWNSAAPTRKLTGFPTVNEAGKESDEKEAKRRKSAPAESRHCKASVQQAPGDEVLAPQTDNCSQGWTDNNIRLFEDWRLCYQKVVLASKGDLLPEDAESLLAEIHQQLDQAAADFQKLQAEANAHPSPKPDGAPSQDNRFNPLSGGKDGPGKDKADIAGP